MLLYECIKGYLTDLPGVLCEKMLLPFRGRYYLCPLNIGRLSHERFKVYEAFGLTSQISIHLSFAVKLI